MLSLPPHFSGQVLGLKSPSCYTHTHLQTLSAVQWLILAFLLRSTLTPISFSSPLVSGPGVPNLCPIEEDLSGCFVPHMSPVGEFCLLSTRAGPTPDAVLDSSRRQCCQSDREKLCSNGEPLKAWGVVATGAPGPNPGQNGRHDSGWGAISGSPQRER